VLFAENDLFEIDDGYWNLFPTELFAGRERR